MTPKETLKKALEVGKEYFGLEFGIVSHIVGDDYTVEVQSSPAGTLYDSQHFQLGSTYCNNTLELNSVFAITDVTKSKYIGHPCHKEFALVSYIGVPIKVNSHVYGTINFSSPNPRQLEYDKIDDEFMKLLGRWAGSFLERQFVLDELSLTKKRFENIFENNASGILVVDKSSRILMVNKRFCEIIKYSKSELLDQNARIIHTDELSYETIKKSLLNMENKSNIRIEYHLKRKDNQQIWCEFLGSPIDLTENESGTVWSILDITSEKTLQKKLEQQAITDYMTNLYNRRYFTDRLVEELSRVKRNKKNTTSLMMFDLDKFKQINDTYGHLSGDEVIKKFAEILKRNLRNSDISARIGGEEFAVILPDTDIKSAEILANRIKKDVCAKKVDAYGSKISFTISIGLTALIYDDISSDTALARVDKALYTAKENGRNRVEKK